VDDIRAATGTSQSQLFDYFPGGRYELLLVVAQYEADRVLDDQQPYLRRLDSWDTWYRWRNALLERYALPGGLTAGHAVPADRPSHARCQSHCHPGDAQEAGRRGGRRPALQAGGYLPMPLGIDEISRRCSPVSRPVSIILSTGHSAHLRAALDWGIMRLRDASAVVAG